MKFAEFNKVANPNDTACYVLEPTQGAVIEDLTFSEAAHILRNDYNAKIYIELPENLMVIQTKCGAIIDVLSEYNEDVFAVYNDKDEIYQIFVRSTFDKNTKNNVLVCGCGADTLVHTKGGTRVLLYFHSPYNETEIYKHLKVVHETGDIKTCPDWLQPLNRGSSANSIGMELPINGNAERLLTEFVKNVMTQDAKTQLEVLKFINAHFVTNKLSEEKLEAIVESVNSSLVSEFFDKKELKHDVLGDYVVKALNIKRDRKSKELYLYDERKNIYVDNEDIIRGYMTLLIPKLKDFQKKETIQYIKDILVYDEVDFNANKMNVVFKNGILHLDEWVFEPMSSDNLETIQIAAEWDEDAKSETVDNFFANATCGDKEVEQLLYEAIGYAMLKTSELSKMFMLIGNGRNGKSTFLDLLRAVLGQDNCTSVAPKDFSNNFRTSMLKNKLASICGDISGKTLDDSDILKQVASGDAVTMEEKYKAAVTDVSFATMFYSCNTLPRTNDNTDGFFRRFVIIPFNADLSKVKNVEGFAFKKNLLSQESINYVAHKAAQAIYKVLNSTFDFITPESVNKANEKYRIEQNSVLSWIKDSLGNSTAKLQEHINNGFAYSKYQSWCELNGRTPFSKQNFDNTIETVLKKNNKGGND